MTPLSARHPRRHDPSATLGWLFALTVVSAGPIAARADEDGGWERPPIIDAHAHLHASAIPRIERIMNENGLVAMVNLSGGNFAQGVLPGLALMESGPLAGRIITAYNPDFRGLDDPMWGLAEAEGLEVAVRRFGYRALKISKALGLYLRDDAGVLLDVDDPRFDPLWEKAGELDVPVFIHVADPRAFWNPPTRDNERWEELSWHPEWSFWNTDAPHWSVLLDALERVVAAHPLTTFVLVHFGNNAEDLDYVDRMLRHHPNAWVDIGARVPEIGRHPAHRVREVFERWSDRILFATDLGAGRNHLVLGSSGDDREVKTEADARDFYQCHFRFLETHDRDFAHPTPIQGRWTIDGIGLSRDALTRIYQTNALRLFGLRIVPRTAGGNVRP